MRRSIVLTLFLILLPAVSQAEVSRYLKTTPSDYKKFYENRYKSKKQEKRSYSNSWTAFGKLVGRVDNLLIIKTKDGKYLLKKDFR